MLPIFIAAWLTVTPPAHMITDSTSVYLAEFQQSVQDSYLLDLQNFTLTDEQGVQVPLYSVEMIYELDGDSVKYSNTKLIGFKVPLLKYRELYTFTAEGLGSYTYFNNGYAPNLEQKTDLIIKE